MATALLIVIAVLLFGFIVFVHEFGHFFTAKLSKIKVNEFAIGMGPQIFSFTKGETKYALRLFPIGGYCAMEGEDEESSDEGAFGNKPVLNRMLVVVAGAVMNMLLGLVLIFFLLLPQDTFASTTVAEFTENSAIAAAGIEVGDRFYEIDGYRIHGDRDLSFALALANPESVDIKVIRNGEKLTFNDIKFNTVKNGDKDVLALDFYVYPQEKTAVTLVSKTFTEAGSLVRMVWMSLSGLVTGRFGLNDVAGPVGAAQAITQAASQGLETGILDALANIVFMMTIITINLGIVNLLPLPALDGGRLLFLIVELVRRKPVSAKYEGWIHAAGFFLLIAFMLLITFNDVLRLITGSGLGG